MAVRRDSNGFSRRADTSDSTDRRSSNRQLLYRLNPYFASSALRIDNCMFHSVGKWREAKEAMKPRCGLARRTRLHSIRQSMQSTTCHITTPNNTKKRITFRLSFLAVRRDSNGFSRRADTSDSTDRRSSNRQLLYRLNPYFASSALRIDNCMFHSVGKWREAKEAMKPRCGLARRTRLHSIRQSMQSTTCHITTPNNTKKRITFRLSFLAVRRGLEPLTPCVTGTYSNQLN